MTDNLDSFYLPLENLLLAQRWKDADVETRRIMLAIARADTRDNLLLTQQDIEEFPCSDLMAIDRLWTLHSEGRFGFSTINRIYREADGDYSRLAQLVGWRVGDTWLNYDRLTFDKTASLGHLPVTWLVPATFSIYWQSRFARVGWQLLLSRWETCQTSRPQIGADFVKLEKLLAAGDWLEADRETLNVLLTIIRRRCQLPELSKTNLQQIPNTDFQTIDRLWQQYSNGKFGFSVQKRIYQQLGNSVNRLALQIGWRSQNKWLRYHEEFNFHLSAPEGHLPAAIFHELGFSVNAILSRSDF